jgi:hypothetical protein
MFPRQQLNDNNEERCLLRGPCQGVIGMTGLELIQFSWSQSEELEVGVRWPTAWELVQCREVKSWLVNELVGELQFSRCELLLLEAGS